MKFDYIVNIITLILIGIYIGDYINYKNQERHGEIFLPFYGAYSCVLINENK